MWELADGVSEFPQWYVKGRTVLISKEGCTGEPGQFRPITCLNTSYKAFTGALNVILWSHVEQADLIPAEQKALRRGRLGCLDAM